MPTSTSRTNEPRRGCRIWLRLQVRRCALLGFALLTIWLFYERWGVRVRLQAELLQRQKECVQFTEAADRVAFEGNAIQAGTLSQRTDYAPLPARYGAGFMNPTTPTVVAAWSRQVPDAVRRMEEVLAQIARYEELHKRRPPPPMSGGGIFGPEATFPIFVHECDVNGIRRLVIVQADWSNGTAGIQLWARVIEPAGWLALPKDLPTKFLDADGQPQHSVPLRAAADDGWIRVYAGSPDPADPAAFRIPFKTAEGKGTIAGRLRADDNIELRLVSWNGAPATRAAQ